MHSIYMQDSGVDTGSKQDQDEVNAGWMDGWMVTHTWHHGPTSVELMLLGKLLSKGTKGRRKQIQATRVQ